jgi:uncharacterized repeat protein (TIGR02543 family)
MGWVTEANKVNPTDANIVKAGASVKANGTTYYAVWAKGETTTGKEVTTTITDKLDKELTGVTSTNSYSSWSDKTSLSTAIYAGNSCGGNDAIQLRSNNSNSGIITTISGGKAKKVTVEWNSSTASGRTLNVYGKNTAYSAATDLYNNTDQGTLLGTIVCGTSTQLTISGDYAYIGMRSASGAMYLTSVSIEWETTTSGGSTTDYFDYITQCTTETRVLKELQITTPPTKTKYIEGETFDPTGATVIAVYDDGNSIEIDVNDVNWSLTNNLTAGKDKEITASYTEDETAAKATTQIDVYSVTLQAKDEDGNEIVGGPAAPTRNGRTITPAEDAHNYVFKEWSIENATLYNNNTTKTNTITAPTDDVIVTAIYYKPITISYWSNNHSYGSQTYFYGTSLSFIKNPPSAPSTCSEKFFVGWVKEDQKDYRSDDTAPTYVTAGTQVESPATYYAVFADLKTVNATVDIEDYADKNNWNNDTKYTTINIDSKITAEATGNTNTGKYYDSGNNWRFYQTESAQLTIEAENGCILKTIQVEYYDNKTKGVLKYNGNNITSNDIVEVNEQSITFTVGSTSQDVTNGQVRVASISVTYVVEGEYENFVTSCEQTYTLTNVVAPSNEYGRVEPLQVTYISSGATTSISNDTYTVNGTTVTAIPAAATAQYTYAFSNWSNLPATVTADATVTANFTRTINKYTITWKNGDDILETDTDMEYGATPLYDGETPTKAATAQYTYTFNGWSPEVTTVTGDATYTATFTETINQYQVTFNMNGHGTAPATQTIAYESKVSEPSAPTADGYEFAGWYKDAQCTIPWNFDTDKVNGITTIYAKWLQIFTITWKANGLEYATTKAAEGELITPPASPDAGDYCGQVFVGWTDAEMEKTTDVAPTLYPNPTSFPTASEEAPTTFYAVFADYEN